MARLQSVVQSDRFEPVAEFRIDAEEPNKRATIRLFRNKRPTRPDPRTIREMERRH